MNSLDLVILLIMAVSVAVSAFRGGVRETFSLLAVVAGFMLASKFYPLASEQMLRLTSHREINDLISFLAIFIFSAVLISFAGGRLTEIVNKSKLKFWNLMAGTAIGTLRGILICAFVVYALMVFLPAKSPVFVRSKAFPFVSQVTEFISPIATRLFRDEFRKKMEESRKGEQAPANKPPEKTSK